MRRFDTVAFTATKTAEGFIRDAPIVGRTGILHYKNADGTDRYEYRPPEEAFKKDSLASLMGKPITIGHKAMVDAENAAAIKPVGTVLSEGRQDGDTIRADIVIYNLDTAARELSCGYRLDLDETPGVTPDGQHYDAVQRNIVYNHLAIVPKGRAGIARLNMDGEQEFEALDGLENEGGKKDMGAENKMTKIRLDGGLEYEAAPEVGVYVDKLRAENAQLRKDAEDAKAAATKEKDTLQAKLDAAVAEGEKMKKEHADAEAEAKKNFDAAVTARVKLLGIAKENKIDKAEEMTDAEIKAAVIKSVRGDAVSLDGKSADYIEAAFDMAVLDAQKRTDGMAEQRKALDSRNDNDGKGDGKHEDAQDDPEIAMQKLIAAEAEQYLKGRE